MLKWAVQNSQDDGCENNLILENKKEYKVIDFTKRNYEEEMNDENYIEFLDGADELKQLVNIWKLTSWTYHDKFYVSKNIFEMKELLKANNFNVKKTISLMLEITKIFVFNYNKIYNKDN